MSASAIIAWHVHYLDLTYSLAKRWSLCKCSVKASSDWKKVLHEKAVETRGDPEIIIRAIKVVLSYDSLRRIERTRIRTKVLIDIFFVRSSQ